ncbi:hypothetical protein SAMN05216201_101405 [Pseudomonas linyingensis]|uniref:Uncharacterized protein n=1 Tax=Pseudomonas linyingensis TaxID=915471 RepID=A0A1H6SDE3_9PSED|nr:hypothetical protein [Pseudomonas linyingensis]SEI66168.1 hypothetical protein SAMN05216201_101405 [Pseudomonas linyingensis]
MELNKAVLDCMQKLRRRLREELGTDIHLSQSDVISALLAACAHSDSLQTHQLGAELARLSGTAPSEAPQPDPRTQPLYRGQVPTPTTASAPPPGGEERQVRIYRGQRIYV